MASLMPPADFIRLLMQQSQAQGSRSTVLNPLGWIVATLIGALVACQLGHADRWASVRLASLAVVAVTVYLAAYVYFALSGPDHLRSERYSLSKMVIESGRAGDTAAGYVDELRVPQLPDANNPVSEPVEDPE